MPTYQNIHVTNTLLDLLNTGVYSTYHSVCSTTSRNLVTVEENEKLQLNSFTPKVWLLINFLLQLLYISFWISSKNLLLDQENNLYLISLSILNTYFVDDVWIL